MDMRELDRQALRLIARPSDDEQAPRPYLGQRCHIESQGFGTIIVLKLAEKNGPLARVELDACGSRWFKVAELELLPSYPAC